MRFRCWLPILVIFFAFRTLAEEKKISPIIALVGPMTGPDAAIGQKISQSVSLLIDDLNKNGGIDGQPIEVLTYDDQGDFEHARKIAHLIADEKKALVVLSYLSSDHKLISNVYQDLKIPVITGSAQEPYDSINSWLFSTLFNNRTQAVFIANYMRKVLNYKTTHIISRSDTGRKTLRDNFELTFRGLGGSIKKEWTINKELPLKEEISRIVQDLLKEQKPADAILLDTNAQVAAEILVEIRRKGFDYKIFGTQVLTDPAFLQYLSTFPEEEYDPGYFSNGVMATSPIIFDVAGRSAQIFHEQYESIYKVKPGWMVANFYDAATLAIAAIKATINKTNDTIKLRELVKDSLIHMDSPDEAIAGLSGPLYFNNQGELVSNISVGVFSNKKLISTFTQLDPVKNIDQIHDLKKKLNENEIIPVDDQYLEKINVVFTGIDFIEISDLDFKKSTYTMDFYLWFRYQGKFDANDIEFINQVNPIALGEPFQRKVLNGVTHEAYRIEAEFRTNFDFSDYPVDEQVLDLHFYNKNALDQHIFYVRDEMGLNFGPARLEQVQKSKSLNSWTVTDILIYQDHVAHISSLGDPNYFNLSREITYSRFNAEIHIKRNFISFAIKNFLPIFIILILIYLVMFTDFSTSISVYVGALLATLFEHIRALGELPDIGYTMAIDYLFYAIYLLLVIQIAICIALNNLDQKGSTKISKKILLINKFTYPLFIFICLIIFFWQYKLFSFEHDISNKAAEQIASIERKTEQQPSKSSLTLSTWNTDVGMGLENVLKKFNEKNNFDIVSKPIEYENYQNVLARELKSNFGPDIFALEGIESESQPIINKRATVPLKNFTLNHVLSDEERRIWTNENGVLQAVPLFGIVNAVYYNKDIFKKLGIRQPTTWEEFIKTGQLLKKHGYLALANGTFDFTASAQTFFFTLAPNYIGGKAGREAFSAGKRCFNDPTVVELFSAISELKQLLPPNFTELNYYDGRELFFNQKAAMWISASWELGNVAKDSHFSWSIFALPAPKGKTTTVIYYPDWAFAINAKSRNYKEARKFLDWLMTKEFEEVWLENMPGSLPLNPNSPAPKNPQAKTFFELTRNHPTDSRWFLPPGIPDFYDLVIEATNGVLAGSMTPKDAANYLQTGLVTWYHPAQRCILQRSPQSS